MCRVKNKKFINAVDLKYSVLNTSLQRADNYEIFSKDKQGQ